MWCMCTTKSYQSLNAGDALALSKSPKAPKKSCVHHHSENPAALLGEGGDREGMNRQVLLHVF